MAKILEKFISGLEGADNSISIKNILSSTELKIFEKWVRIFNSVTPFTIKEGLENINKKEKMTARDEVILLAYIKFFEQKLKHLRQGVESYGHLFGEHNVGAKKSKGTDHTPPNDGDMYA